MNKAIVIPESWSLPAGFLVARLNKFQPRFFTISIPDVLYLDSETFLNRLYAAVDQHAANSTLVVLPHSWAEVNKIQDWPPILCNEKFRPVVNSIFFADEWKELEDTLLDFLCYKTEASPKTHLTCQYQQPYTNMLNLWSEAGAEDFHPGDFYKSEILSAISTMTGNWVYWGHGEANLLRGYGHLGKEELLAHIPKKPLNATLWFTCSTLDYYGSENIALSWYRSGATKCLLASPNKINTEANQILSAAWLAASKDPPIASIAGIVLKLIKEESREITDVIRNYYLLGNPWVLAGIGNQK
ncbi:hypothetical protein [Algoriphagus winogradskyi]|uniref:Gingipain domain-containing protein n=1 Tax=Algoriphagus winogradskyi TaxID=237017 RepID=A0ABY1N932_9BACT|nr:hypothetical protein [Algoriphagus winogradskyi]SMP03812.1 hypothetical protein SAMN06265367_101215 [Algoriphagus winogradskyi]